jgi:DNA-binding transcriptional LysR family regulator
MTERRNALTPEALAMIDAIARTGSFAAAARELGKVPSALTYQVRQLEHALDGLLFDRRSRRARLTAAGEELLWEGRRLLVELDALSNRVHRVASGWETQLTIACETLVSSRTLFDLVQAFYSLKVGGTSSSGDGPARGPGTRLCLRTEVLAGTWEALVTGIADLVIGATASGPPPAGVQLEALGEVAFVLAVAPQHPLARRSGPIPDDELARHRAVAIADSAMRLSPLTFNLLQGQDVLTVPNLEMKVEAQLRGLGCGYLPEPLARSLVDSGRLVALRPQRGSPRAQLCYAWRAPARRAGGGLALKWWLERLRAPSTRRALLKRFEAPVALPGSSLPARRVRRPR